MKDVIDPVDGAGRDGEIGEVAFDEFNAGDVRQVLALAGDQAVDDAHASAAADELFREVGTDEAGAAGDEVGSHTARYLSKIAAAAGPAAEPVHA